MVLWIFNVLLAQKVPRKTFTLLLALVSIHKGLVGRGDLTETLEVKKSQMWLQSSFLVGNKSSCGFFPCGWGSQPPAVPTGGSGDGEARTQLS